MSDAVGMNILFIQVDQWPGRLLGCDGHRVIKTPTLDELSLAGTRFTNAYSSTPVCIPARRELMTGTCARVHGDKVFNEQLTMPKNMPTLPGVLADAGYQCFCVGKLHVFPQRDRIGFDDVILMEEGRHKQGLHQDDYERFVARNGYAGQEFMHGMCNNNYLYRPWHLPEYLNPTTWVTQQMCETIKRKDPTRPAFWYASYNHPHPPLVPLQQYLDIYRDTDIDMPYMGEWTHDINQPSVCGCYHKIYDFMNTPERIRDARRAFYALCTHIDHQIRTLIGTIREEGLLDNTCIVFTSDHGEMLGNHGLWGKNMFYEDSSRIPLIIVPPAGNACLGVGIADNRLVELRDIMPTLLTMAGIAVPDAVDGMSLTTESNCSKEYIYGELWTDARATRMIRKSDYKLIYCPVNNVIQLFNIREDPQENYNLHDRSAYANIEAQLQNLLMDKLYGPERGWIANGKLIGMSAAEKAGFDNKNVLQNRELLLQRGLR